MPDGAIIPHTDGSKTVIEQDPSGDYHVYDQMPDGSSQERGQFGSAHTIDEVVEMFTRPDDSDIEPGIDPGDAAADDSGAIGGVDDAGVDPGSNGDAGERGDDPDVGGDDSGGGGERGGGDEGG
jgi:hypothetical protein